MPSPPMGPTPPTGPAPAQTPHASPYRASSPSSSLARDDDDDALNETAGAGGSDSDVPEATWIIPSPLAAPLPSHSPSTRPTLRRTISASLVPSLAPAWISLPPRARSLAHWLLQASWQGALSVPHQSSPEAPRLFRLLLRVFARAGLCTADWRAYVSAPWSAPPKAAAQAAADAGLFPSLAAAMEALALVPTEEDVNRFVAFAAAVFANMGNYSAHDDSKFLPPIPQPVFISLCLRAPASAPEQAVLVRERWRRRLLGPAGAERDLVKEARAQSLAAEDARERATAKEGATEVSHWRRVSLMLKACIEQVYNDAPEVMHLGSTGGGVTGYYSQSVTESDIGRVGAALRTAGLTSYNTRLFRAPTGRLIVSVYSALPRVGPRLPLPPRGVGGSHSDEDEDGGGVDKESGEQGSEDSGEEWVQLVYEDAPPRALGRAAACLAHALPYAPTPAQARVIDLLGKHLAAGDCADHEEAQRMWVRSPVPTVAEGGVDFNLGFVESYRDYYGARCEWEGFVSLLCPHRLALSAAAVQHFPYLSRRLPCPTGTAPLLCIDTLDLAGIDSPSPSPSSAAITAAAAAAGHGSTLLLGFAGSAIPTGVNLPNYASVRDSEGHRDIRFANVHAESTLARAQALLATPQLRSAVRGTGREGSALVGALSAQVVAGVGVLVQSPASQRVSGVDKVVGRGRKGQRRHRHRSSSGHTSTEASTSSSSSPSSSSEGSESDSESSTSSAVSEGESTTLEPAPEPEPVPLHPIWGIPLSECGYFSHDMSPSLSFGADYPPYEASRGLLSALYLTADAALLSVLGIQGARARARALAGAWASVAVEGIVGLTGFHPAHDDDNDDDVDSDPAASNEEEEEGKLSAAHPLDFGPDVRGSWSLARAQACFAVAKVLLKEGLLHVDVSYTHDHDDDVNDDDCDEKNTPSDDDSNPSGAFAAVATAFPRPNDLSHWRIRPPPASQELAEHAPRVRLWLDVPLIYAAAAAATGTADSAATETTQATDQAAKDAAAAAMSTGAASVRAIGAAIYRLQLHRACNEPVEGAAYLKDISAPPAGLLPLRRALLGRGGAQGGSGHSGVGVAPLQATQPHTSRVSLTTLRSFLEPAAATPTSSGTGGQKNDNHLSLDLGDGLARDGGRAVVPKWCTPSPPVLSHLAATESRRTDLAPRRGSVGVSADTTPPAGALVSHDSGSKKKSNLSSLPRASPSSSSVSSLPPDDADGDDDADVALLCFQPGPAGIVDATVSRYCLDAPAAAAWGASGVRPAAGLGGHGVGLGGVFDDAGRMLGEAEGPMLSLEVGDGDEMPPHPLLSL